MSGPDGGDMWLIATLISLGMFLLALIGGVIARDRAITRQIREGDEKLHERVNRIREDMVHKDDQNRHLERIDRVLTDMREEQREHRRETTMRLDQLLAQRQAD